VRPTWRSSEAFEFYIAAIASFLESAIDHYVENLTLLCCDDPPFVAWLQGTWLIEERRHGVRLRHHVKERWPGFCWAEAYEEYGRSIPHRTTQHLNPSRTLEMLSRCVTETEAAMMYRCIAIFAVDPDLKRLARELSGDEVGHYREFRRRFAAALQREKVGLASALRTILDRARLTIDRDVALAFDGLKRHWAGPPPFPLMAYGTFLQQIGIAVSRHFPVSAAERMLLKPLDHVTLHPVLLRHLLRPVIRWRTSRLLRA
jgi:hypothetical protein